MSLFSSLSYYLFSCIVKQLFCSVSSSPTMLFEAIFPRIRESLRLKERTIREEVFAILTVSERLYWTIRSSLPTVRLRRFRSTPVVCVNSTFGASLETPRLRLVEVRVNDLTPTAGSDRVEKECLVSGTYSNLPLPTGTRRPPFSILNP